MSCRAVPCPALPCPAVPCRVPAPLRRRAVTRDILTSAGHGSVVDGQMLVDGVPLQNLTLQPALLGRVELLLVGRAQTELKRREKYSDGKLTEFRRRNSMHFSEMY